MRCEICGRHIMGKPAHVKVEGAKLLVCVSCAKLGTPEAVGRALRPKAKRAVMAPAVSEGMELVPNYAQIIKKARSDLALSQVDLAKRIGEKVSVLKRLEQGKLTPDTRLATKLENKLRIKLFAPRSEVVTRPPPQKKSFSIADLARMRKRPKTRET